MVKESRAKATFWFPATTHEVVEKSGSWFSYGGERMGQGRENARVFLKEHTDIRDKIDATLRQKLGLTDTPPVKPALAGPGFEVSVGVASMAPRSVRGPLP